jgi:hypothetical protein
VRHRTAGAPGFDVVEVTTVRDWREWERVPTASMRSSPVNRWFDKVIDGAAWR